MRSQACWLIERSWGWLGSAWLGI